MEKTAEIINKRYSTKFFSTESFVMNHCMHFFIFLLFVLRFRLFLCEFKKCEKLVFAKIVKNVTIFYANKHRRLFFESRHVLRLILTKKIFIVGIRYFSLHKNANFRLFKRRFSKLHHFTLKIKAKQKLTLNWTLNMPIF